VPDSLRVAIAGGGIGGLALAHGLRRAGILATVYERDPEPAARRQGYRIHISPAGADALRSCLPPELYELFLATRGQPGDRVTVLSSRLRVLREFPAPPAPGAVSGPVNRLTLREVLLGGLADAVSWGRELRGYELAGDTVRLRFADGTAAEADVLVGADGINSAVRGQRLPRARVADTGTRVIYGKTPLTRDVPAALPAAARRGFVAVTSLVRPVGMALGLMEFSEPPPAAAARLSPGTALRDCGSYVMWALSAQARVFPPDVTGLDGTRLTGLAARMTRHWHRTLRVLVAAADPAETFALAVRTAEPVAPWPASRVTVLGDAIHAMSPAGGSGANTALRDAGLLARELSARPDDPVAAIARYETEMRDYGFAAVRAAEQANARYHRG
jgi:2-polyprenyl-6-methoxyphenol hydroxylase-like FAD-dependent oxidoreductase